VSVTEYPRMAFIYPFYLRIYSISYGIDMIVRPWARVKDGMILVCRGRVAKRMHSNIKSLNEEYL